jgi:hypothetical protein
MEDFQIDKRLSINYVKRTQEKEKGKKEKGRRKEKRTKSKSTGTRIANKKERTSYFDKKEAK